MMCLTWASELPLNWPHMASRFTGLGYEASIMSSREVLVASGCVCGGSLQLGLSGIF